ncbi:antitoxin [Actimicrobium sp. CCC2.4]|uniref:AbrB/MazE/SpoVT family DNA-binding domain-containing protein n=1 Tax=Actimicrobium sp. CCC2.4 TaxID=3048606 RepID=UPI002AC9DF76|nr:antitoxin [Actimicrobium sp. CCC2.4]MEB0134158.1 antitoxin [Actimicrobium sp. CCC2.4]WPX32813.1 antitoxin [Actimicrobium sp. CCC2.4]
MLAVPPAIHGLLHLHSGSTVDVEVDGGHLIVHPQIRKRYTFAELLAGSDYSQPHSIADDEWVAAPAVGREL